MHLWSSMLNRLIASSRWKWMISRCFDEGTLIGPLDLLGKLVIYRTNTCAFAKLFCNSPVTLPPSRCLFLFALIWVPTVGDIMKPLKRCSPPGLQERRDAFLGICHRWALASISAAPQRTTTTGAEIIDSFQNQSRHILLIFTPAHSHDTFSNTTASCAHR